MAQEEQLELRLGCAALPPECNGSVRLVVMAMVDSARFAKVGQTELVENNLDPQFQTTVQILARLDCDQQLKFVLCLLEEGEERPFAEAKVDVIVLLSQQGSLRLPLDMIQLPEWDLDENPLLTVDAVSPESNTNGTRIQLKASNLPNTNVVNAAPYFTLSLLPSSLDKFPVLLYRSEVCWNSSNPKWNDFVVPSKYMSDSTSSMLEIACYHFVNNKEDDQLIGRFTVTFFQLLNGSLGRKFMLHCPDGKNRDNVFVEVIAFDSIPNVKNFVSLFKAGLKLHFTVGIDFTANNGGPNEPTSLHYIHPHFPSLYGQALHDISSAVSHIDKISVVGFGAKVPPKFEFSNMFALNGDPNNPVIRGTSSAMDVYRRSAMSVLPYAPADFSSVIHHVFKFAKVSVKTNAGVYFVLVILTNGFIKQTREIMDKIVESSEYPMSIILGAVGNESHPIGNGDHSRLSRFIDPTAKSANNKPLRRQITSYIEYKPDGRFARSVLKEIPLQVTQWSLLSPR